MRHATKKRILRLDGSPLDDLVRFEDAGEVRGERVLIPHLLTTTKEGPVRWCPLSVARSDYSSRKEHPEDAIRWPIWRFLATKLDIGHRIMLANTRDPSQNSVSFGTEAETIVARQFASIWLEFVTPEGTLARWSTVDPAEFACVSLQRNRVRFREVRRLDMKRLFALRGRGRRDLSVVIDTRRLWEAGWLVGAVPGCVDNLSPDVPDE